MTITELRAMVASTTGAEGQTLGSAVLDSETDRDWIQEYTDQDQRQENGPDPSWMSAMEEESETLVISQFYTAYDMNGMEYLVG